MKALCAPVALVGPRCSGKTTVGKLLAERLGRPFVDLDAEVVGFARYAGFYALNAGELIEEVGWARFRDLEASTLKKCIEPMPRIVLATGGGVCERPDNRAWLVRATRAFYLDVPTELLQRRLEADGTLRPPLGGGGDATEELPAVARRRDPHYRAVAERIPCSDRSALDISDCIVERLENRSM